MIKPNFKICYKDNSVVLIKDLGPWDKYPTVTNRIEELVEEFKCKKLFYFDSDGILTDPEEFIF